MLVKEKTTHNTECRSESHDKHLCYIVSQGLHLGEPEKYKELVKNAEFRCRHCNRLAKSADNLCEPEEL